MPSITPIIYGIVGVLALIGALWGLKRGIYRQTVRTVTIILSVVLSFVAIGVLQSTLFTALDGMTVAEVIDNFVENGILAADTDTALIENLDMKTAELALALPIGIIVAPLLFVIAFIIISALLLILHVIICALCGFKSHRRGFFSKLLGFVLGLLQGAAVAGLLLMPLVGIGNMAKNTVTVLEDEAPNASFTETISDFYETYAEEFVENPAIKIYSSVGINALYENIATVKVDEETSLSLAEIAPDAAYIATEVTKLSEVDINNLTITDQKTVDTILEKIDENPYFGEILSGLLNSVASAYINGDIEFKLEAPFNAIIDEAVKIFQTSTRKNLTGDLKTITDVMFILSRDGIFSSFNDGSDALLDILTKKDADGKTTVNKVIDTIKANDRTKPLVTVISKISLSVMSAETGMSEDVVEKFENIKSSINTDVLSINREDYGEDGYEEYVADVSTAIDTMLKDNEIELEKDIVDTMAEYVAENYSDISEIGDEEINDIILSYYDAYLEYLENQNNAD